MTSKPGQPGNANGSRWGKGQSGNPSGRASVTKALRAAGFDPDSLRVEVIQACVKGIRELDPGSKDEGASWRFCVDKLSIWTGLPGKPAEATETTLSDEEYQEELTLIATEHIRKLPPEEKFKLLNTAPSDTVQ